MASKEINYNNTIYQISYEIHNSNKVNEIIFLHGWGSNKEIMKNSFNNYLDDYKQIYIDLPGFGNSSIKFPIDSKEYSLIIGAFLKSLHVEKNIVVGHSFGGKVATMLNPNILVLLSTAGILNKKSFKTKLKIVLFKLLKPVVGNSFYRYFATKDVEGMSKVMYETLKKVVNEDFSDIFTNFSGKAFVYWGRDDKAVPLDNARKIAKLIKNSKLRVYDGDHFFFLNNAEQICKDFRKDL